MLVRASIYITDTDENVMLSFQLLKLSLIYRVSGILLMLDREMFSADDWGLYFLVRIYSKRIFRVGYSFCICTFVLFYNSFIIKTVP